jgi:hypothetical protein
MYACMCVCVCVLYMCMCKQQATGHMHSNLCVCACTCLCSRSVIIVFITLQNQSAPSQMTSLCILSAHGILGFEKDKNTYVWMEVLCMPILVYVCMYVFSASEVVFAVWKWTRISMYAWQYIRMYACPDIPRSSSVLNMDTTIDVCMYVCMYVASWEWKEVLTYLCTYAWMHVS